MFRDTNIGSGLLGMAIVFSVIFLIGLGLALAVSAGGVLANFAWYYFYGFYLGHEMFFATTFATIAELSFKYIFIPFFVFGILFTSLSSFKNPILAVMQLLLGGVFGVLIIGVFGVIGAFETSSIVYDGRTGKLLYNFITGLIYLSPISITSIFNFDLGPSTAGDSPRRFNFDLE